jgi:hypothetical protein
MVIRGFSAGNSGGAPRRGVLAPPLVHLAGDVGDLHAEDERQPGGLNGLLVRLRDHARIRDDPDAGQAAGGHELLDRCCCGTVS